VRRRLGDIFDHLEEPRGGPRTDFERFSLITHAFVAVTEKADAARATELVHRALTVEEHGYYESVMRASVGRPMPAFVLTLLDRFDVRTVPADVPVIAWIRNWTDRWLERPWLDRVDVLLGSSTTTCDLVERRTGRRPALFPLATNPERFAGAPPAERTVDCVFTGNHWGEDRAIQGGLAPAEGQTLAIHGRNWERIRHLAPFSAGPAPYDALPAIYASARLVLDDTQEPTLRYDAVNARVFDALAAGTLVLTNCAAGVRELFDDGLLGLAEDATPYAA
jgi:hypothetical protein